MRLLLLTLLALGAVWADDEEKKEDVGTVVGIDLGTTYSWCVGTGHGGMAGLVGSAWALEWGGRLWSTASCGLLAVLGLQGKEGW